MKDIDFDKVNRFLNEKATICVKEVSKDEKKAPKKMVQKDEMEDDEEAEEKREVKNFKLLDKAITKLSEYLTKTGDEKALKVVEKIAQIVGTELEAHKEEE